MRPATRPTLGRLLTAAAALSALALGAAGCGPSDEPADAATKRPNAAKTLKAAVDRLIKADTGRYLQEMHVPKVQDPALFAFDGDYVLSARAAGSNITYHEDGHPPIVLDGRIVGDTFYMHSAGWAPKLQPCWLAMDASEVAAGALTAKRHPDVGPGLVAQYPAALLALPTAQGTGWTDDGDIRGTIELPLALNAIYPGAPAEAQQDAKGGRAEASFQLRDGALVGWEVTGDDLLDGMSRNDSDLGSRSPDVEGAVATVTFSDQGVEKHIDPPPPNQRLTIADTKAGRSCHAAATRG